MLNRIYIPKSISTASTAAQLITFIIIQLRTNEKESRVYALIEVCARKKLGPFIIEWLALSLAFAISDGRL